MTALSMCRDNTPNFIANLQLGIWNLHALLHNNPGEISSQDQWEFNVTAASHCVE
jgi:hypothetical protein